MGPHPEKEHGPKLIACADQQSAIAFDHGSDGRASEREHVGRIVRQCLQRERFPEPDGDPAGAGVRDEPGRGRAACGLRRRPSGYVDGDPREPGHEKAAMTVGDHGGFPSFVSPGGCPPGSLLPSASFQIYRPERACQCPNGMGPSRSSSCPPTSTGSPISVGNSALPLEATVRPSLVVDKSVIRISSTAR